MNVGTKPAKGPLMPMSNRARRPPTRGSMAITAPKVPNGENGQGNEVGQTGIDPVAAGLKEMAHLVAQQDRHHRHGVAQAGQNPQESFFRRPCSAPTNSVLRHVATNSSSGSRQRRRGRTGRTSCHSHGAPGVTSTTSAWMISGSAPV